ncbi:Fungal Zn(2)-Cys(6) binuclear cluster domain, partial [Geosmithia morbida]
MVYCGKPSKGCSNCRDRKVRCDQREPACGQCEKRQQKCPGYRNLVDLMFRDESTRVIKKAMGRTSARGAVKKPTSSSASVTEADALVAVGSKATRSNMAFPVTAKVSSQSDQYRFHGRANAKALMKPPVTRPRGLQSSFLAMLTPTTDIAPPSSDESEESDVSDMRLGAPLSYTLQERGTAFFFSRYVAVDFGCYQNYDFVYDVWRPPGSESGYVDCVTASMAAVGLAGLSKVTRCGQTMMRARQSYGNALKLTNTALQDPVQAVKDSTMLSVLILGTYEFITGRTPQTMAAWKDHVNGAAALTRMRGIAPFRTKAGIRMFLMLCHSVLISCIQGGLPMSQSMLDLRDELGQFTNTNDPTWRIVEPICRALQIRYDIKNGMLRDTDEIVDQLADVEKEFSAIVDEMPRFWRYRCARVNIPNAAILSSWCHIYPGFAQATTWNGMRTMRVLVQETILEELCSSMARDPDPPMRHRLMLSKSMRLLELLGDAVVASTPQHFGVVSSRDAKSHGGGKLEFVDATRPPEPIVSACPITSPRGRQNQQQQQQQQQNQLQPWPRHPTPESPGNSPRPTLLDPTQSCDGRGDPKRFMTLASASNTIVWPLYTLGMSSSCTRETRHYLIDRLDVIHKETGLDQARVVKQLLQDKVEYQPWDRIPNLHLPEVPDEALPLW